jgi:putative phosphoesterase
LRVIVFSDSHGRLDFALKALKEAGQVDYLLHAGDFYRDALALAEVSSLPVKAVRGNSDRSVDGPVEELFKLDGRLVYMAHGHLNGPHRLGGLLKKAVAYGAKAVIFGHTHMSQVVTMKGVLLFNPGSISKPRDREHPSYGILEFGEEGIKPSILQL